MTLQETRLFQPMKGRINRPLRQRERAPTAAMDFLDDGIAVRRAARERREHDHVQVALEHVTFHGHVLYA
jgi:hypothetical protein